MSRYAINPGFFSNDKGFWSPLGLRQAASYLRHENLPLETKSGRRLEIELVANVYQTPLGNHHRQRTPCVSRTSSPIRAFAPDGKTLASTSDDTTTLLWDVIGARRSREVADASFDRLWSDLASDDAAQAFRAMGAMVQLPGDGAKNFHGRLQPVNDADSKHIDDLVADLNSEQYAIRCKATLDLERLADLAVPALSSQLATKPSVEVHKRIEILLAKINGSLNPALLRALRAVEVLERIGTPQAQALLDALAKGAPAHRLTRAAQDALRRLQMLGV